MASERNPLPLLVIIALVLWCGLYLLKNPDLINSFRPSYPALENPRAPHRGAIPASPAQPARAPENHFRASFPNSASLPPRPHLKPDRPLAAIILDDFGYEARDMDRLRELYLPVTVSVLPNLPGSRRTAELARASGYQVMLHLPMEPINSKEKGHLEKKTLAPGMTGEEVRRQIDSDLASVGMVSGVNNHMGSLATTDTRLMEKVFSDLKDRNLFFVDSVTGPRSVAFSTAREMGVEAARRDVFLDNESKPEYIKEQIRELIKLALKNGRAVGIGHDRPETLTVLKEMLPEFEKAGVSLVPVSQLTRYY